MHKLLSLLFLTLMLVSCDSYKNKPAGESNKSSQGEKKLISDIDQTNCSDIKYCGDIGELNCGAEVDGPLYYFDKQTEEIISTCGGACWRPDEEQQVVCETLCPPPSWDCNNEQLPLTSEF